VLKHRMVNVGACKKRVLIVENDDEMRSLLKDFMEEAGFEADSAANGLEAFREIEMKTFDLIISDIRMPGLSGFDILPKMKKLQPEAYIILITAFGSEETHRKSIERGASAYLEKPIHFDRLKTLMDEAISCKTENEEEETNPERRTLPCVKQKSLHC
jgi:two-component system, response regulator, stage 0 sporulation protein F